MKRLVSLLMAAAAATSLATPAQATVVDFDDLSNGDVVTNQYAGLGVTFSSSAGAQVLATAQNLGSSLPNFICSGRGGQINCVDDVYVDFASAISGLTFLSIGANNVGDVGDVRVFAGAILLGTVDIMADGTPFTPDLVDLGAFLGITRIEIVGVTDAAGLGFDDFTFNGTNGAIPEPGTWAMMLLGFGAVGFAMRRRRSERLQIA
jgi:hypothetical protein